MIQAIAFYIFATVVIVSAGLTIASRNPVHSVMWLILAFFNAAGLMVLCGAEFIAMLLVIVYVGAVAVLFLFVVMMLDIEVAAMRAGFARYLPLGLALLTFRFAQAAWKVLTGAADSVIASHEAEEMVEEAAAQADKEG